MTRTMPARTSRAHFTPSWRGDRPAAIRVVAKRKSKVIDQNWQWAWNVPGDTSHGGVAVCMHWTTPKRNNYRFILEGVRVRRMTKAELGRAVRSWPAAQVLNWRRTSSIDSDRPWTYAEMTEYAVKHGVTIAAELKSTSFAHDVAAQYLINSARAVGHPTWYMALINMANCRGKCQAIERNGGQFAVIFGKFRRLARKPPKDWAQWNPKPSRLWGPAKWPLGNQPPPVKPPPEEPVVATSQNGYTANDRSRIKTFTIPGTSRKVALRFGAPGQLLCEFAAWFDKAIESVDGGQLDDWGYAERPIRGSKNTLSNHASGTALDINAPRHPLGKRGTFTPGQASRIRAKLKEFDGAIRWGGDYKNRADEMHFEIMASPERCATVLKKVTQPVEPPKPPEPKLNPTQKARALAKQSMDLMDEAIKASAEVPETRKAVHREFAEHMKHNADNRAAYRKGPSK